jgi:hypothetical protein
MKQIRIVRPRPVRPRQTPIDTHTPSGRVLPSGMTCERGIRTCHPTLFHAICPTHHPRSCAE